MGSICQEFLGCLGRCFYSVDYIGGSHKIGIKSPAHHQHKSTRGISITANCVQQDLAGSGASIYKEGATIELHSMELEGYGPYRCALDPAPNWVRDFMP